jgi:hypothetical protein
MTLVGASGMLDFSLFGANLPSFAFFVIFVFPIPETVVMYFFVSAGDAIKPAVPAGLGDKSLWVRGRQFPMLLTAQLMLTIFKIGGWFIHIRCC